MNMQALTSLFIVNHHIAHSWFIIHCAPFSNPLCDDWHWTNTWIWVWIMVGCMGVRPPSAARSTLCLEYFSTYMLIFSIQFTNLYHSFFTSMRGMTNMDSNSNCKVAHASHSLVLNTNNRDAMDINNHLYLHTN